MTIDLFDIFKFEENPLPNAVYTHGMWECIFYSASQVSDIANKNWKMIHKNMCDKYGYDSVGLDKELLYTIYNKANGTGGVDVGLIYNWVANGLVLRHPILLLNLFIQSTWLLNRM